MRTLLASERNYTPEGNLSKLTLPAHPPICDECLGITGRRAMCG
jgi:hypothetical protein